MKKYNQRSRKKIKNMAPLHIIRITSAANDGGLATQFKILDEIIDSTQFKITFIFLQSGGQCAETLRHRGRIVYELKTSRHLLEHHSIRKLIPIFKSLKPDIIHSSGGRANYCSAIAGRIAAIPTILTEEVSVPTPGRISRIKHGIGHALSNRVVAVSDATRDYVVSQEFCPQSKTIRIYNCYGPHFDDLPIRRTLRTQKPFRLLMVSRLSSEKNHLVVLHALKQITERTHYPITLTIVGEGPFRAEIETTISDLKLENSVTLVGYQDNVIDWFKKADLYLLPSTIEGFGISLIEAMRCGVPVLGARTGGIPEILETYPPKHLLPPTDVDAWTTAISKMMNLTVEERTILANQGIQIAVKRFSPSIHRENIERLYSHI